MPWQYSLIGTNGADTTSDFQLPAGLVAKRTTMGPAGIAYLERIPMTLRICAERWSLTLDPPFRSLSYNYAAPVRDRDGRPAVLKVCEPDIEFIAEVEALHLFAGESIAALLNVDFELGAMLLERVEPGDSAAELEDDEEATSVLVSVMKQLWRPPPSNHAFPLVTDWAEALGRIRRQFDGTSGPLPETFLAEGERLFAELTASVSHPMLLHGDCHHHNVLRAERQPWLAIDPKGVVGDPIYDTACTLYNPIGFRPLLNRRILVRRVDQLAAELGCDRQRVRDWGIAQMVLSACWTLEDHGEPDDEAIELADMLRSL